MGAKKDQFNAAGSAAGYIYQVRLGLAEALRFAYADSGVEISIEKFDDVAFDREGSPFELLQAKHHVQKKNWRFDERQRRPLENASGLGRKGEG